MVTSTEDQLRNTGIKGVEHTTEEPQSTGHKQRGWWVSRARPAHGLDAQGLASRLAWREAPLSGPDEPRLGRCFAPRRTGCPGLPGAPALCGRSAHTSVPPAQGRLSREGLKLPLRGRAPGGRGQTSGLRTQRPAGTGATAWAPGPQQVHSSASPL